MIEQFAPERRAARPWVVAGVVASLGLLHGLAISATPPALQLELSVPTQAPASRLDLKWSLFNVGDAPLRVASHVLAGTRLQFDELTLRVCEIGQTACKDVIFKTARAASFPVQCVLQSGQRLSHQLDLSAWLAIQGITLPPGRYELQAFYRRDRPGGTARGEHLRDCAPGADAPPGSMPDLWTGLLRSPVEPLTIVAEPTR